MSMRISDRRLVALVLSIALAGCGSSQPEQNTLAAAEADQQAAADDSGRIVCAVKGARDLARVCTLDREQGAQGLVLTVRSPDGGFHRLQVTQDGRGVVSADGAESAQVTVTADNQIEVALAGDRYRLPATVRATGR